jgi:hypothetical protein
MHLGADSAVEASIHQHKEAAAQMEGLAVLGAAGPIETRQNFERERLQKMACSRELPRAPGSKDDDEVLDRSRSNHHVQAVSAFDIAVLNDIEIAEAEVISEFSSP